MEGERLNNEMKIVVTFLTFFILLVSIPSGITSLVNQSKIFSLICKINPFVMRMSKLGNQPEYALFCYGVASVLLPYFLYILIKSNVVKASIAKRYRVGGKQTLRNSAIVAATIFIFQ